MANWYSVKDALSVIEVQKKSEDFVEKVLKKVKANPLWFWPFLAKIGFFQFWVGSYSGTSGSKKKVFLIEYNPFGSQNQKEIWVPFTLQK